MVIEHAEQFGLSQLHQLRGRVGRGAHQSWCILIGPPRAGDTARERLKIMEATNDGFLIAEKDLELRGPGDFIGTRQSGVPGMRIGNIVRDMELLQQARAEAFAFIEDADPARRKEKETTIRRLRAIWQKRYGLVLIG
jgi:ATP-dependent DNA helicase RecG